MQWLMLITAVILSLGAGYWVYRADRKRAVPYPFLTAGLRTLIFLSGFLLLLAPSFNVTKNETQQPVVVVLQDNSTSVPDALKGDTAAYRRDMQELLDKLGEQYRVVALPFGAGIQPADSLFTYGQPATDLSAALERVAEVYGQQNLGAVILASDGRYNQGNNPVFQKLPVQVPVYTVALGDSTVHVDLAIRHVYANKTVSVNGEFEVKADLRALRCEGYEGKARLLEDGRVVAYDTFTVTEEERFYRTLSFRVSAGKPGLHRYVVEVPAIAGEPLVDNNRREVFVEVVDEKKRVLIAAAAPHPDVSTLRSVLGAVSDYRLTVSASGELPGGLDSFSTIILHNLPATPGQAAAVVAARSPLWLISSTQVNPGVLRPLQNVAGWQTAPVAPRTMLPEYNPAFAAFIVPANIRAVTERLPPLYAPAGIPQAPPNAEVLFGQRQAEGAPLWWLRPGTRPVAVLAGEGLWRWRLQEYRHFETHTVIDECIRQTVQLLSAQGNEQPFLAAPDRQIWNDQEAVWFHARLLNPNNEEINTPDATLVIRDSAGKEQSWHFERAGNVYRINTGVRQGGRYTYTASVAYNGNTYTAKGGFAVESVPLERMESGANYGLLYNLARKYKGSFVTHDLTLSLRDSIAANDQIRPEIRSTTSILHLIDRKWFFFLLLLFAAAEWLLRKYWMAQ
jgi:hypothetical protein